MNKSGWNPTQRNRNIGTAKQGYGNDNQLVIPKSWPDDRVFWEVLKTPVVVQHSMNDNEFTFLVEPTSRGCVYPCTVEDIVAALQFVPSDHLDGLELIIFRQPTQKQKLVSNVWGRFLYYAVPGQYSGSAICIEAQDLNERLFWDKSLSPDDRKELERLESDGHRIRAHRRSYEIVRSTDSIRNTVLFRTLFHEVGHYVDWLESVLRPNSKNDDTAEVEHIRKVFSSKPSKDKEDFAHRYADRLSRKLADRGDIPFPPVAPTNETQAKGIDPNWFAHWRRECS